MNLTVYIPKHLCEALQARARREKMTPSRYVQRLVKERLSEKEPAFSEEFKGLAGSWEDERSAESIVADIRENRAAIDRAELR